jgi:glycosyltransferase involved in cell wall biosynthesis
VQPNTPGQAASELSVLYYQVTLGPAHFARIRALDALPGIRCHGVQLASGERTRAFALTPNDESACTTIAEGVYEDMSRERVARDAIRHLIEVRPDAIIIDALTDWAQARVSFHAKRRGIAVFMRWATTTLDYERQRWREWLKSFLYGRWDGYLTAGIRADEYLRSIGVDDARIYRCGNPVEASRIDAAHRERAPARRAHCFLFVGRFIPHKNLDRFLRAFARYREAGGDWGLRIAGLGPLEASLRAAAKGTPGVEFLGHLQLEALIDEYLTQGCLVLPSISENWGLVVNEAMHAGMPILISTPCGCHPELLDEGGNGFSLDPTNEDSMAASLERFAALDEPRREAMSARSREIIANHLPSSWARSVAAALRTDHERRR